ncbi:MAG TPA: hypothetical protein PLZ73_11505 [bacterium]|nr:hypothetical protein [bacterium]
MTSKVITREVAVGTWVRRAMVDFFAAFQLEDLSHLRLFFYHQGIEKLCKALLIGTHADQFADLDDDQTMKWIDTFARSLKHDLADMIDQVVSDDPQLQSFAFDKGLITVLMKGYQEGRYPTPSSKSLWRNPGLEGFAGTDLDEKAYQLGFKLLERLNKRFDLEFSLKEVPSGAKPKDWERFCNIWNLRGGRR